MKLVYTFTNFIPDTPTAQEKERTMNCQNGVWTKSRNKRILFLYDREQVSIHGCYSITSVGGKFKHF